MYVPNWITNVFQCRLQNHATFSGFSPPSLGYHSHKTVLDLVFPLVVRHAFLDPINNRISC